MTLWIIYLTSTHPKLSKTVYIYIYVYCIIPSIYLLQFFLNGQKQCVYGSRAHHFVASQMN